MDKIQQDNSIEWMNSEILCQITDALNTYNFALSILKSKGYKLFMLQGKDEFSTGDIYAISKQQTFSGSDPLRLLAVVTIWENFGDNWGNNSSKQTEDCYKELMYKISPESVNTLSSLSEENFKLMVSDYRIFLNRLGAKNIISENISHQDFFDLISNEDQWVFEEEN